MESIIGQTNEKTETNNLEKQIVTFLIQGEMYAFDIYLVKEIINLPASIEPIPDTAEYIVGVYSLRGEVIPIIDLKKRFKFRREFEEKPSKVIVTQVDQVKTGFVVDDVKKVKIVSSASIQPPPPNLDNSGEKYIKGVIKDDGMIMILNLDVILTFDVV